MLLWHLAATTAITRYAFRDERMDLRLLLIGAVLSDLIDTPIGLVAFPALGSVRLAAHSLLFAAAVMVAVMLATRRGRPRKRWMPLAIGVLLHLFLDAMWSDPETLWWPLFGSDFATTDFATAGEYLAALVREPLMWAGEAAGLGYVLVMWRRAGMADPEARRLFRTTGLLNAPIGSGS